MAFGAAAEDAALRAAWNDFCDKLRAAGEQAFKDANPANPLQRADAFRFLTQNLGQAFDLGLETKDTRYPLLHAFCSPTRKLGGDAGDFSYQQAWIDGASRYRLFGDRGTARFLNVTVQGPRPEKIPNTDWPSLHEPFGDIPEANLFAHQLKTEVDGRFEIFIGGPERGPNWLPTTPGSRKLFIRQGFDAWKETPARMQIERLDMEAPKPAPTPDDMIGAMDWAGTFVTGLMHDWPEHPHAYSGGVVDPERPNIFPQIEATGADQKRGRAIAHMCWTLRPDEALIIEFNEHDAFWMLTNSGAFFNSMDYLYRQVSYTPARTKTDSDGMVRLILAHEDPGCHNWLDTQGFAQGNITYRELLSPGKATLSTRLVKRAELDEALPADTAKVTPEERRAQMLARFYGVLRRYPL